MGVQEGQPTRPPSLLVRWGGGGQEGGRGLQGWVLEGARGKGRGC